MKLAPARHLSVSAPYVPPLAPQHSLRVLVRVRWRSNHNEQGSRSFFLDVIPQKRQDIGMISAPATFYLPGSES